jgi:hypothetical protein
MFCVVYGAAMVYGAAIVLTGAALIEAEVWARNDSRSSGSRGGPGSGKPVPAPAQNGSHVLAPTMLWMLVAAEAVLLVYIPGCSALCRRDRCCVTALQGHKMVFVCAAAAAVGPLLLFGTSLVFSACNSNTLACFAAWVDGVVIAVAGLVGATWAQQVHRDMAPVPPSDASDLEARLVNNPPNFMAGGSVNQ